MAVGVDDFVDHIVDRINVAPRFIRRSVSSFDYIEMNTVRPEINPTHQHDDPCGALDCQPIRLKQTLALLSAHSAVMEIKMEITNLVYLLVPDLLEGLFSIHVKRVNR